VEVAAANVDRRMPSTKLDLTSDHSQAALPELLYIPPGRAGTTEEMAAVAVFLCSAEAAYITGLTLFVDGGLALCPDFRTAWSSE
jgi:NAD(P)-dependent dehydrogenase (short-subunit alcohol dehydrogenase family)